MKDVLIIGGGAAGVMAAIQLAKRKKSLELWDKNDKLLKKVLVSGNGRCNITNKDVKPEDYYTSNNKILYNIFNQFSHYDTIDFFDSLGLEFKEEKKGKLFPITNQAISVYDVFLEELQDLKVPIKLKTSVEKINILKDKIEVINQKQEKYFFKNILIATGGKSYSFLGSSGDGFNFAKKIRHKIIQPVPGLVPLVLEKKIFNALQGVKTDVEITAQKKHFADEMMFTHYGLSGPAILDLSLEFAQEIADGHFPIQINFFPGKNQETLKDYLKKRWTKMPKRSLANSFAGILPSKAIRTLLSLIEGINPDKKTAEISKKELNLICSQLTNWEVFIKESRGFQEAQVTKGGISIEEINFKTMESKLVPHVYFAGEVLDVTGRSGGFNLQFAWSSGFIAGTHIE